MNDDTAWVAPSHMALAVLVLAGAAAGSAAASSDSLTFIEYPGGMDALNAVSNGTLDMHTDPIPLGLVERALGDANLQVHGAAGASLYALYLNPAVGESFNPFSIREVRYAMNHLLDRDSVVRDGLHGYGTAIPSLVYPLHPDYPLVYRQLDELGISYDPVLADRTITKALWAHGAYKADGIWYHDGNPVSVTMFVQEYPVAALVSEMLTFELERVGFVVEHRFGDLAEAFNVIDGTDPADFEWHMMVEVWGGFRVQKANNGLMAWYYGPWIGNMPGGANPDYWNYENRLLDDLTRAIYREDYESAEERARLFRGALAEGMNEAVRLGVAVENSRYLVNGDVTGVVNVPGWGLISRYNTLNAQAPDGDLTVGARYITQSAWNPVGGFTDTDTVAIWYAIRDPAYSTNPFTGDLMPVRAQWRVDTTGPDGSMALPEGVIIWNPFTHEWEAVPPGSRAASKVTFDLALGNWHNGAPMDVNDILYDLYFTIEHMAHHDGHDHDTAVEPRFNAAVDKLRGIRVVDDHTIEVYTDHWDRDPDRIVRFAAFWADVPWDLFAAMEAAAMDGRTAFRVDDAQNHGVSWLSMLDTDDTELLRGYLVDFIREGYVPAQVPYAGNGTEYALYRYDSTISWIDENGHSVISSGPYRLEAYWPENGTLRAVSFDDDPYPFEPGHWSWLSELGDFGGTVLVGSVAPLSGGADRYGADVTQASILATADFNEYLERRGEPWRMEMVRFDSMTDPEVLLHRLQTLNGMGIGVVDGPAIDIVTDDTMRFANDHGMLLLSCCSSTPSLAIEGDSLFRLLPDQGRHGEAIARLMHEEGIRAIAPVGIEGIWSEGLLEAATTSFIAMGGSAADMVTYGSHAEFEAAAEALADTIIDMDEDNRLDRMAVLYVGYGGAPGFMNVASGHKILGDIRWFGADQNTAWPNVLDNTRAAAFAGEVAFTVVQPSVPDDILDGRVHSIIGGYLETEPSPYAIYEYDSVWLLGLSIMYARSADPAAVMDVLPDIASRYVGLIGSTQLNPAGDLADTNYAVWVVRDGAWRMVANDY